MLKVKYKRMLAMTLVGVGLLTACDDDTKLDSSKNSTVTNDDLAKLSNEQSKEAIKNIVDRETEGVEKGILDAFESKFQNQFGVIYSHSSEGVSTGTVVSDSGIFFDFEYVEREGKLTDIEEKTQYKLDLSEDVRESLKGYDDDDLIVSSYLSNTGVLNVTIAKQEGVELPKEVLDKVVGTNLSTVIEVRVYSMSKAAYAGLSKSVFEDGKLLTTDLVKGYLFTSYESYTSEFDTNMCLGSGAFSYTTLCSDYRAGTVADEVDFTPLNEEGKIKPEDYETK